MKQLFLILLLISSINIFGQDANQKIPSVNIKDLNGKTFNTSDIKNDGKPIIISFWATWCKPCCKELASYAEHYEKWKEETGVKIYAIAIDDSRSSSRVQPFINGKDWDFDVLIDSNGDFKRALNVVNVPHTFIIDKNGNIVYQHTVYADGDEFKIIEEVKKLTTN